MLTSRQLQNIHGFKMLKNTEVVSCALRNYSALGARLLYALLSVSRQVRAHL